MNDRKPATLNDRMLTAEAVSEVLGMCVESVYRAARRGEIPYVKLGRSIRFPRSVLEEWIAERARESVTTG